MFLAVVLMALSAVTAFAGERVPLTADMVKTYDGFGADANETGPLGGSVCLFNEASTCVFGDTSCNAWVDLTSYSKLYITIDESNPEQKVPRIFINRTETEGQFNSDETQAKCLVIPNDGTWAENYYTKEGDTYVINVKKIILKYGFCHLHAVKGLAWNTPVTMTAIEAEKADPAQQIGWVSIIKNGGFEESDLTNFPVSFDGPNNNNTANDKAEIVNIDERNCAKVVSFENATETWHTQFFVKFNEFLPEGTKWRISFDARAERAVSVPTSYQGEPRVWQAGGPATYEFTTDWQNFTAEGVVEAGQVGAKGWGSFAFDLNNDKDSNPASNTFYFDNIKFEIFKPGTVSTFDQDAVQIDFGFNTNISELVKASKKPRLVMPAGCASVTSNGEPVDVMSVEGYPDGRFYIFIDDTFDSKDKVYVTFKNPADEAFRLKYTSGPGGDVKDYEGFATNDPDLYKDDTYAYAMVSPTLMSSEPEDGSFNLPVSTKEFKMTFDKEVQVDKMQATLNSEKLTISPAEGLAKEVTLTRTGSDDLKVGKYILKMTKLYPEIIMADEIFGDTTVVLSFGKVSNDPNDVPKDIVPIKYFNECASGGVPEGFTLFTDGDPAEERTAGNNYGSGARMFDFAGGDFTKGLYMRTWYLEYGKNEGYELNLEAAKKYTVSFNSCRWNTGGEWLKFQILNEGEEEVYSEMIDNVLNVNEKRDAVTGSVAYKYKFVPSASGKYIMRWVLCTDKNGTPTNNTWANGVVLANVAVKYVPDVAGIEETNLLNAALEKAKATRDANAGERFDGAAFTTLDEAVKKYEAEAPSYTAPSAYKKAADALDAAVADMAAHRTLIDTYDPLPAQAHENAVNNAEKKFAKTELYAKLVETVAKYATFEKQQQIDEEGNIKEVEVMVSHKDLKDDAELKAAIDELQSIIKLTGTSGMFTEGASNTGTTGYAALLERIRLGVETAKKLGVEDDALYELAANSLTDNDNISTLLMNNIRLKVYEKIADNSLFAPVTDENLEETVPSYDMTVFLKNPNFYVQTSKNKVNGGNAETGNLNPEFKPEAAPGWTYQPDGGYDVSFSSGWDAFKGTEEIPVDASLTNWACGYNTFQTIENLPAGVYTVKAGLMERTGAADMTNSETGELKNVGYLYAKNSTFGEEELGDTVNINTYGVQDFNNKDFAVIENVVVTDGKLTIGVRTNGDSHLFWNYTQLWLTGKADGVDYANALKEEITGVDAKTTAARVVRVELYDLKGNRIPAVKKGVVIVKKYMSDGKVVVEKVIK